MSNSFGESATATLGYLRRRVELQYCQRLPRFPIELHAQRASIEPDRYVHVVANSVRR
jgi:hypothetical protein